MVPGMAYKVKVKGRKKTCSFFALGWLRGTPPLCSRLCDSAVIRCEEWKSFRFRVSASWFAASRWEFFSANKTLL